MYRIHPAYLCWVLESLVEGEVVNQIKVDPDDGALGAGRARADARDPWLARRRDAAAHADVRRRLKPCTTT